MDIVVIAFYFIKTIFYQEVNKIGLADGTTRDKDFGVWKENKQTKPDVKQFFKEFQELQNKYGIRVFADYEEEIDYDYEGESYVSGIESYLSIYDQKGVKKVSYYL